MHSYVQGLLALLGCNSYIRPACAGRRWLAHQHLLHPSTFPWRIWLACTWAKLEEAVTWLERANGGSWGSTMVRSTVMWWCRHSLACWGGQTYKGGLKHSSMWATALSLRAFHKLWSFKSWACKKHLICSIPVVIGTAKDIGVVLDSPETSPTSKSLQDHGLSSSLFCHLHSGRVEMHLCSLLLSLPCNSLSYLPEPDQMPGFPLCSALNVYLNKQKQTLSKKWSKSSGSGWLQWIDCTYGKCCHNKTGVIW